MTQVQKGAFSIFSYILAADKFLSECAGFAFVASVILWRRNQLIFV